MDRGISIIIPTLNGGEIFSQSLAMIQKQKYKGNVQLIVIDSGSADDTPDMAKHCGATVISIDHKDFHHARTRNHALPHARYDKVLYTVQDAVPCSETWLDDLERALSDETVSAAYVRQIPHKTAGAYARFEVEFHGQYLGNSPMIQAFDTSAPPGSLAYDELLRKSRLDNVCAIYRKNALMQRPFPEVDFGEDLAWAYHTLLSGGKILYQPEIQVMHSHDRPPDYRFRRAIADSVSCMKIFQRVKDDFSDFGVKDMIAMTLNIKRYSRKLRKDILQNQKIQAQTVLPESAADYIIKNCTLPDRIKTWLIAAFPQLLRHRRDRREMLENALCHHIQHVLHLIQKDYMDKSQNELPEVLEQVTASVLGRIYGEIYAGKILHGTLTPETEHFIRPFLKGI
ncbi:MAG: glycosyltransferase family 2 protein [Desulfococcaceae bacterium]|nr:glycosyltransferase family 2 protein [Desulfococcaceae bacterium]